jgi:hypothetical protein
MKIGTTHNNKRTEKAIKQVFGSLAADSNESYQFDFEQGHWWVTELGTGRQWSVVDVAGGDFDFEIMSYGDR